jgi:pilus assembly protein CpaC
MRFLTAPLAGFLLLVSTMLTSAALAADDAADWLDIELGKSVVLETPKNATAIAITAPKVARVVPLASANKIQIQGLSVGSTDLVVQLGPGSEPIIYELTVHRDLTDLIRRVDAIVEGEPPRVYPLEARIVVQGPVDDLETLEQVALVARVYDSNFINLMTVRGDHQVQLEVLFAELSRTGFRELGFNYWYGSNDFKNSKTGINLDNGMGGSSLAPGAGSGGWDVLAYLPSLGTTNPFAIAAVLSILDDYRLSKIMAQPILVAMSGQQAEFLSGGELPLPQSGGAGAVSINFKEYGILMSFVPTVLGGNIIDLVVYVEVSEPDFAVATNITGIEVPGFVTRKIRTHVRVESGKTFAIAGLISEDTSFTRSQFPLLGDIPLIGTLFRYVKHQRSEAEVMIFVTPRLVRPLGPGEVPAPPGSAEDNNPGDLEFFLLGMDRRPGSRTAEPAGTVGLDR